MDEIKKLYDVLIKDGYYTKSFEDFQVQFASPEYVDKVFNVVSRDGLYTKDKDSFVKKYTLKKKKIRNHHLRMVYRSVEKLLKNFKAL